MLGAMERSKTLRIDSGYGFCGAIVGFMSIKGYSSMRGLMGVIVPPMFVTYP
jgi:hypothetical protein